jgi:hypothetical protein
LWFVIGATNTDTCLDGIAVIAGSVLNILRLYTAKTFIFITSCVTSGFGGGNRPAYKCGFTLSGKIKTTIACEKA